MDMEQYTVVKRYTYRRRRGGQLANAVHAVEWARVLCMLQMVQ